MSESIDDVASWLIASKWMPPRHHVSIICRPRLIETLDKGFEQKLCLVCAPAGFGKTTLLSQWRQQLLQGDTKVAWLTLDEADSDINNLLCYMIFSLISAGLDLGRLQILADQGLSDTSPRACMGLLLSELSATVHNTVLILDDYHRIGCEQVDRFIDELLGNAPDNFHLIISSRERPGFDISRLRSQGQVLEFGPELLRFDAAELTQVIGSELSEEQSLNLLDKSAGWPVTIQLVRQAIAAGGDREQVLASYSGKSNHLAEYLSEQILKKCKPEVQEFLIKTSILERVNNSLGEALSGISEGVDKLEKTSSISALFVPLDENKQWFRYHHLLSEFLQEELHHRYPEHLTQLHLSASCWFEQDDNLIEAVRHACLAQDYDRSAMLIEQAGGWELILYGGIAFLRRLLQYIPEPKLKGYPRLQVAKAYLCQKEGAIRAARGYLEQARDNKKVHSLEFLPKQQGFKRDLSIISLLQSIYEDDFSISSKHVKNVDRNVDFEDGLFNGVLNSVLSLYMMAEARFDQGIKYEQLAVRYMRQAESVLGTNYCYLHLGTLSFYQGNLRQAEAYFLEAQAMADENFGSDSGLKYVADLLLFSLRDWRGETTGDLQKFENTLQHVEDYDGWYEVYIAAYELLLVRALRENKVDSIVNLRRRCQRVVDERVNQRLQVFVSSCDLYIAMLNDDDLQAERILHHNSQVLNPQADKTLNWRPLQHFGAAAASWYIHKKDFKSAESCLQFLEASCRDTGAVCFLVDALNLRAEMEFQRKQLTKAASYLFEAASLAWPENIMRPFARNENSTALIAAASGISREQTVDRLSLNFLQQCSSAANKLKKHSLSQQDLLSSREMEVLLQLKGGLSNKEIARALEMTEHTVKFHLKNIFSKLGVDKRTKAIVAAKQQGVLE